MSRKGHWKLVVDNYYKNDLMCLYTYSKYEHYSFDYNNFRN